MEVILDTSFILTCIKEKIDFLEAEDYGELVLPMQVLEELDRFQDKGELKEREQAKLALDIIEKNKGKFKVVDLEKKFVDAGIKSYVKGKKGKIIVASLDAELKRELRGKARILTIRARKKLMLE